MGNIRRLRRQKVYLGSDLLDWVGNLSPAEKEMMLTHLCYMRSRIPDSPKLARKHRLFDSVLMPIVASGGHISPDTQNLMAELGLNERTIDQILSRICKIKQVIPIDQQPTKLKLARADKVQQLILLL